MDAKILPAKEEILERFDVDKEKGILIRKKWGTQNPSCKRKGYLYCTIKGKEYPVHRIVWKLLKGDLGPKDQIDHINGLRSDNRLINLRKVTNTENQKNQRMRCTNNSGVMGISWDKSIKRWVAYIYNDGKKIHLGSSTTKDSLIELRKEAEIKLNYHKNHGKVCH